MNQTTAARVAAYIDGEGCLSRKKWRRKDGTLVVIPTLWITNTAVKLIEWFQDRFGGYVSAVDQRFNWKTAYRWILEGLPALELVQRCTKWFIVKVEQVKWYVRYRVGKGLTRSDHKRNWRISERIQRLNKRGR